ncbi:hypothetical protein C7W93_11225 [Glaciimonas sp. PCH181]|nr:hypothetical protein C7W93_11225 [Glaciimonas sp. PCH181]
MLTLRNLLLASAIAVCATAAVAQTTAPDPSSDTAPGMAPMAQPMAPMPPMDSTAPMDSSAPMMPSAAPVMIPIPGTDQSMMNRYDDPLVQARVARSEGKTLDAYRQAHQMRTVDDRAIGH